MAPDLPAKHAWLPALMLLALAACGDAARVPGTDPGAAGAEPRVWQGLVACADCAGIDTRLRLEPGAGGTGRYQLAEAFLDGGSAEYYREEGRWHRDGGILTLRAASGGMRFYRIDDDGRLLPADRRGRGTASGGPLLPQSPAQGM